VGEAAQSPPFFILLGNLQQSRCVDIKDQDGDDEFSLSAKELGLNWRRIWKMNEKISKVSHDGKHFTISDTWKWM